MFGASARMACRVDATAWHWTPVAQSGRHNPKYFPDATGGVPC